jgi:hypothetical protein
MRTLKEILKEIDTFRPHPRFKVEQHFDIIFLKYVPRIVNQFKKANFSAILPEFPVQKSKFSNARSKFESISVDYALFDLSTMKIGLVEFKTDSNSNNDKQDKNMISIQKNLTPRELIEFVSLRSKHKKTDDSTEKFKFLERYMAEKGLDKCVHGAIEIYKISPDGEKESGYECFPFSKIISEYHDSTEEWALIREYLKKWNSKIKCV